MTTEAKPSETTFRPGDDVRVADAGWASGEIGRVVAVTSLGQPHVRFPRLNHTQLMAPHRLSHFEHRLTATVRRAVDGSTATGKIVSYDRTNPMRPLYGVVWDETGDEGEYEAWQIEEVGEPTNPEGVTLEFSDGARPAKPSGAYVASGAVEPPIVPGVAVRATAAPVETLTATLSTDPLAFCGEAPCRCGNCDEQMELDTTASRLRHFETDVGATMARGQDEAQARRTVARQWAAKGLPLPGSRPRPDASEQDVAGELRAGSTWAPLSREEAAAPCLRSYTEPARLLASACVQLAEGGLSNQGGTDAKQTQTTRSTPEARATTGAAGPGEARADGGVAAGAPVAQSALVCVAFKPCGCAAAVADSADTLDRMEMAGHELRYMTRDSASRASVAGERCAHESEATR